MRFAAREKTISFQPSAIRKILNAGMVELNGPLLRADGCVNPVKSGD